MLLTVDTDDRRWSAFWSECEYVEDRCGLVSRRNDC